MPGGLVFVFQMQQEILGLDQYFARAFSKIAKDSGASLVRLSDIGSIGRLEPKKEAMLRQIEALFSQLFGPEARQNRGSGLWAAYEKALDSLFFSLDFGQKNAPFALDWLNQYFLRAAYAFRSTPDPRMRMDALEEAAGWAYEALRSQNLKDSTGKSDQLTYISVGTANGLANAGAVTGRAFQ